jgi:hypothetical protein
VSEKLLMVEVSDPDLENRIDSVRYKWDGVNSYYSGGDPHSWQRYTKKIPIPIDIIAEGSSVVVSPRRPLQRDVLYAIVLRHGIPATSRSDPDSANAPPSPSVSRVAEDKLFFFNTLSAGVVEMAGKNRGKKNRDSSLDAICRSVSIRNKFIVTIILF